MIKTLTSALLPEQQPFAQCQFQNDVSCFVCFNPVKKNSHLSPLKSSEVCKNIVITIFVVAI